MEFRLVRPKDRGDARSWHPLIYYGEFSKRVVAGEIRAPESSLLLQTAACGPPSDTAGANPYFRRIHIDPLLAIKTLAPHQRGHSPLRDCAAMVRDARSN